MNETTNSSNNNELLVLEDITVSVSKQVVPEWKKLELTVKEIKFLCLYITNGFNGSQAYLDSIARKGTKKNAAATQANLTLNKPNIKKAFLLWKTSYIEATKPMLEPKLLQQLKRRAFYDITTFINDKGEMKNLSEIPKEWRCCIDGVDKKYYGKEAMIDVITIKLADKDKAMDRLEHYIHMIEDKGADVTIINNTTKNTLIQILGGKK